MLGVLYFSCSLVLLIFAYFLKFYFTHPDLKRFVFALCFFFNLAVILYHNTVLNYQQFLFYGYHPELLKAHPSIIWIAGACTPLHMLAVPRNERLRWRFRNR